MSEMVERVATAIAVAEKQWDTSPKMDSGWAWENTGRGRVLYLARAAIEAMREPTEAMTSKGMEVEVITMANDRLGPGSCEAVWDAMIDAALSVPSRRREVSDDSA